MLAANDPVASLRAERAARSPPPPAPPSVAPPTGKPPPSPPQPPKRKPAAAASSPPPRSPAASGADVSHEIIEEPEDATAALHRMLAANDPVTTLREQASSPSPARVKTSYRPPVEEEAEDATEALHRMLAGNDPVATLRAATTPPSQRPPSYASSFARPPASPASPAVVEAEDATAALHRMLTGNNPMASLRAKANTLPKSAPSAAVDEEAEEAEEATAALHRMLAANDPVANLRASASPKRASDNFRRRPISPLMLPDEPATKGMFSAAVYYNDNDEVGSALFTLFCSQNTS
jgi:hypothetical protein